MFGDKRMMLTIHLDTKLGSWQFIQLARFNYQNQLQRKNQKGNFFLNFNKASLY